MDRERPEGFSDMSDKMREAALRALEGIKLARAVNPDVRVELVDELPPLSEMYYYPGLPPDNPPGSGPPSPHGE